MNSWPRTSAMSSRRKTETTDGEESPVRLDHATPLQRVTAGTAAVAMVGLAAYGAGVFHTSVAFESSAWPDMTLVDTFYSNGPFTPNQTREIANFIENSSEWSCSVTYVPGGPAEPLGPTPTAALPNPTLDLQCHNVWDLTDVTAILGTVLLTYVPEIQTVRVEAIADQELYPEWDPLAGIGEIHRTDVESRLGVLLDSRISPEEWRSAVLPFITDRSTALSIVSTLPAQKPTE